MKKEGKHPGGRPPIFKSPEEMREKVEAFFLDYERRCEEAEEAGKPKPATPSKAHLMLALGMKSRDTFNNYKNGNYGEEFSDILKEAELRLESMWAELLATNSSAGVIFYMKNAFGYRDKIEQDITSKGEKIVSINIIPPTSENGA